VCIKANKSLVKRKGGHKEKGVVFKDINKTPSILLVINKRGSTLRGESRGEGERMGRENKREISSQGKMEQLEVLSTWEEVPDKYKKGDG